MTRSFVVTTDVESDDPITLENLAQRIEEELLGAGIQCEVHSWSSHNDPSGLATVPGALPMTLPPVNPLF